MARAKLEPYNSASFKKRASVTSEMPVPVKKKIILSNPVGAPPGAVSPLSKYAQKSMTQVKPKIKKTKAK